MTPHRFASTILFLLAFVAILLPASNALAEEDAPHVVVSIKPIHSLVAAVTEGVTTPVLLADGKNIERGYTLQSTGTKALSRADIVFLVSHEYETFLTRPLAGLSKKARIVPLIEADGVMLLPRRRNNLWTIQEDLSPTEHRDDDDSENRKRHRWNDPYIWLAPDNAIAMLKTIAETLSEIDPDRADIYEKNAADAIVHIYATDRKLKKQLGFYHNAPYMVLRDAYQYFETHYGLNAIGAITTAPDIKPDAKRIGQVKDLMTNQGVACVFSEPSAQPSTVIFLAEQASINMGEIDPLGVTVPSGKEAYATILENLANTLVKCFVNLRVDGDDPTENKQ